MMNSRSAAPSANPSHELAEVRARIADINRQLASTADARVPKTIAIERLDAWLQTLAERQNEKGFSAEFTYREQRSVSLFTPMFLDEQVESLIAWATKELLRVLRCERLRDGETAAHGLLCSKLGPSYGVEHVRPARLHGETYGTAVRLLNRSR